MPSAVTAAMAFARPLVRKYTSFLRKYASPPLLADDWPGVALRARRTRCREPGACGDSVWSHKTSGERASRSRRS